MQTSPQVAPSYDGSALDAQPLPTNDTNALSDREGAPKPVVLAIVRTAAPQEPMESRTKEALSASWENPTQIDCAGTALISFDAALAWAARCYREGAMESASAYLTLAQQYLERYGELPGALRYSLELVHSLAMISAHVEAAAYYASCDHSAVGKAIGFAEDEMRRYVGLTSWNRPCLTGTSMSPPRL